MLILVPTGWCSLATPCQPWLCELFWPLPDDHSIVLLCIPLSSVLALSYQPELKPQCLIMVDIMGINDHAAPAMMKFLTEGSIRRRDVWPSREEAYKLLKARPAWRAWDDRVLRAYVVSAMLQPAPVIHNYQETGLRDLPTLEYPDKEGVTLKCTRRQETVKIA